jgi:hypothetical protein
MGYDGYWNFYQVTDKIFPAINFEFAAAKNGLDNSTEVFFHGPFADLDDRVSQAGSFYLPFLDRSVESKVFPTAVLLHSIGRDRFSQLPGYLGNMLIHSSDIDRWIFKVSRILDLDREIYFQEARRKLGYGTGICEGDPEGKEIFDLLDLLPTALAQVKSSRVGFLALVTWKF